MVLKPRPRGRRAATGGAARFQIQTIWSARSGTVPEDRSSIMDSVRLSRMTRGCIWRHRLPYKFNFQFLQYGFVPALIPHLRLPCGVRPFAYAFSKSSMDSSLSSASRFSLIASTSSFSSSTTGDRFTFDIARPERNLILDFLTAKTVRGSQSPRMTAPNIASTTTSETVLPSCAAMAWLCSERPLITVGGDEWTHLVKWSKRTVLEVLLRYLLARTSTPCAHAYA